MAQFRSTLPPLTPDLEQEYNEKIRRIHDTFIERKAPDLLPLHISSSELPELITTFARLVQESTNVRIRAAMFMHYCTGDVQLMDMFPRLMGMVACVSYQHELLSHDPPQYVLQLDTVKGMLGFLFKFCDTFKSKMMPSSDSSTSDQLGGARFPTNDVSGQHPSPLPQPIPRAPIAANPLCDNCRLAHELSGLRVTTEAPGDSSNVTNSTDFSTSHPCAACRWV